MVFIIYQTDKYGGSRSGEARAYQANAYHTAIETFQNPDAKSIQFKKGKNIEFELKKTKYDYVIEMHTANGCHFLSDRINNHFRGYAHRYFRWLSENIHIKGGTKKMTKKKRKQSEKRKPKKPKKLKK